MGLYAVLHIHSSKAFKPTESFLRETLTYMNVTTIETAFGDKRESIFSRIRKKLFPRLIETASCGDVFWENDIDIEHGISLWKNSKAHSVHFSLADEGWSSKVNKECKNTIYPTLSDGFMPWECGIKIGPWQAHDYSDGNVIARGNFSITKSANGNPLDLKQYEDAFAALPSVVNLIQYLETQTHQSWSITCELT